MNNLFKDKRKVAPGHSWLCLKCKNHTSSHYCTKPDADLYETGIKEVGAALCNRLVWNEYWMKEYFGSDV
jgi:hypothetical protein